VMLTIVGDYFRFLLFKPLKGDVPKNWPIYLVIGLIITWIVGFGRTWDFDAAPFWIRSGATSVIYAFALAFLIWAIGAPLGAQRWTYRNVLLMVLMTAAPGIVYALPVERLLVPDAARGTNMLLLLIVATWRMALFRHYLGTVAQLTGWSKNVAWLLPPTIIVVPLSAFGVLQAIAAGMGGVRERAEHGAISETAILILAIASWLALPVLGITFVVLVLRRIRERRRERRAESAPL
jgi:hypothetical protein